MTITCTASAADPPAPRAPGVANALRTRAAISNGSRLNLTPAPDSVLTRRQKDLFHDYLTQFGAVDEADVTRCRNATRLALQLEQLDDTQARGEAIDPALAARLTGRLERILDRLEASQRRRKRGVR